MSNSPSTEVADAEVAQGLPLKQGRLVGKVLSPAVRLWLRSQVEQVEDLQLKIEGGDRQILTGYIPRVSLSAVRAVYQGLHLPQVQLVAENIRVNLGQVLKGKPLRLLEPIRAKGEVRVQEADLNASLKASLLANGLTELLVTLLQAGGLNDAAVALKDRPISWQEITIDTNRIKLRGTLANEKNPDACSTVTISTGIELVGSNELRLDNPQIEGDLGLNLPSLASLNLDLGSDVDIQELTISPGQLNCRGSIMVRE